MVGGRRVETDVVGGEDGDKSHGLRAILETLGRDCDRAVDLI